MQQVNRATPRLQQTHINTLLKTFIRTVETIDTETIKK